MERTTYMQKKRKGGFTLAEFLVVIAITTILAGVSFVAAIRYQSSLRRMEMDRTAKEIFLAAQNNLSLAKSGGVMERLLHQYGENDTNGTSETESNAFTDKIGIALSAITGSTGAEPTPPNTSESLIWKHNNTLSFSSFISSLLLLLALTGIYCIYYHQLRRHMRQPVRCGYALRYATAQSSAAFSYCSA